MPGVATLGLSALAGMLSTLSPCVLPLVPILMSSAIAAHRLGSVALAGGVALSFTLIGVLIASAGAALGLDPETVRRAGAVLMIAIGVLLLSAELQARFAAVTSGLSGVGNGILSRMTLEGLGGQFALGLLLGLVWTPCVGPTLGAAVTLASQGGAPGQVATTMAVFGIGASLPLLLIGGISRAAVPRTRATLREAGRSGKRLLGAMLLLLGALILTHTDRMLESWLIDHTPGWLTALTTRF